MEPLQPQLTLFAVEWQEFPWSGGNPRRPSTAPRETPGSGPTLTSPVESVLADLYLPPLVFHAVGAYCPLNGSDYFAEVIQGATFKEGIKHVHDAAGPTRHQLLAVASTSILRESACERDSMLWRQHCNPVNFGAVSREPMFPSSGTRRPSGRL